MGHVRDRWMIPGEHGRRVKGARWGQGKRWQARWLDESGRERSAAFGTRDEATVHLARIETGAPIPTAEGMTLRTYATGWLAGRLDLRPTSLSQIRSRLDVRILPDLGDLPMAAITRTHIRAAVTSWSASGAGPRTVRSTYGTLSQILKAATLDGLIPTNPAKGVEMPRLSRDRVEIPDAAKVHQIEAALPARLQSMALVIAATGIRIGEARGLTVDRIKGDRLTVDRQRTLDGSEFCDVKTAAAVRTIHMGKLAREAIRKHLATYGAGPDGLIWRGPDDQPLRHDATVQAWARMRRKVAGLPARGGWHLLRHYNASVLIAAGLSVRAVADRLGHEDPSITLRTYSHLWPTDQRAAADAIDAALGSSEPYRLGAMP